MEQKNHPSTLQITGKAGVKCVCYNFMPVYDWLRSELEHKHSDGSNSLAYDDEAVIAMNPLQGNLSLPGWDASYESIQPYS